MKYLKLIRYQNLLMLAFMQLIFRYGFEIAKYSFGFKRLAIRNINTSTVLIAAAG
jgi:4-hydroxybenzoate polyprenyltransferase